MKTLLFILTLASQAHATSCTNDYSCGFGERCIGATNPYAGDGQCVKAANPQNSYERPKAVIQNTCNTSMDCGTGESCDKNYGDSWGVCR